MPATLLSVDVDVLRSHHNSDFFSGRAKQEVLGDLRDSNVVLVSATVREQAPREERCFSHPRASAGRTGSFRIADVYYDYSSERRATTS